MNENRGMKKKTIEKNIKSKINTWLKSISNEELRKDIPQNIIVTGGCIASMLQGDMPNDYDIYFKNLDIAKRVVEYYLKKLPNSNNDKVSKTEVRIEDNQLKIFIKSAGIASEDVSQADYSYFEYSPEGTSSAYLEAMINRENKKESFKVAYMTSNAITLTDGIQLITRFHGDPEDIHKNFDFVHCLNYFTYESGVVFNQNALVSILSKELKYVGSLYPICSLFRLRKFIKRGWTITAGEIFKIAYDVSELNLNNIDVLREQLIGVDQAYFMEILSELENIDKNLDRTYMFELINRIFDECE